MIYKNTIQPTVDINSKCWQAVSIIILLLFTISQLLTNLAECSDILRSKSVYTFGQNNDKQTGRMTSSAAGYSISYNTLLDKVLSNGSLSWQIANEGLIGLDPNVSVKLKKIVKGFSAVFFLVEYSNLNTSQSLGEYIYAIGSNQNGQASMLYPPFLISEPTLIYIYTSVGKSENPFLGKTSIKQMECVYSCLILTSDGIVYRHAGENYNHYATGRWYDNTFLPLSYQDPDTMQTLNNVKYEMVAVGGGYGYETFFALTNYGHVFSFGEYTFGLRGTSSSISRDVPTLIPGLRNITFIAAGMYTDVNSYQPTAGAVTETGMLWTWGSNGFGQMGVNNATLTSSETPQQAIISNVKSIVFGFGHLLIILKDGQMYGCGDGSMSEITGIPGSTYFIPTLINVPQTPIDCSLSLRYTACIMNDGKLYTWGDSTKLAHSDSAYYLPADVPNNENTTHIQILAENAVAYTSEGHSVVWGSSNSDSLGALGDEKQVRYPTKLPTPSFTANENITVLRVVSSSTCTYLLSHPNENGLKNTLEYWGPCSNGLSFSEPNYSPYPAPSTLTDSGVVDVSYNIDFAIGLTSDGSVYGWGQSSNSNMGQPDATLTSATLLYTGDVQLICAGSSTSFILLNNGTLLGVGLNSLGELGLGHTLLVSSYTPVNTSFLSSGETIVDMKTGEKTTYILTSMGNVYGAGSNTDGYISSSGDSNFDHFVLVSSPVKIKKIFVGYYNNLMTISTSGDAYYFSGAMYKISFPSNDSYIIDLFGYSRSYYFITKRGSVYTSGTNQYYQISSQNGLDEIMITSPKLYVSRNDLDGIPYTGAAGEGRAILITRYEYTCGGINSTDENVCSSKGHCKSPDVCECFDEYSGSNCETFYCNGIAKSNTSFVCSGRGTCNAPNQCTSCQNSIGNYCEINLCYGIAQNDTMNVCSGRGQCVGFNTCQCSQGFYGNNCQFFSCFDSLSNSVLKQTSIANRFCQKINKYLK
ncbi:predicted protein [Naegleria gruberi]|uniref:Predicted protein n=1 Tax=Naegleria gruberi TaxID=5762 RepID=D2V7J9_NAEGR|nr:uncharacterized protein NAEGRDRAFT_64830 [Naegleria gruberi]EFC47264.1 predicted protein [Naegleria gruberi]|eukprot:XP_002680008.1 predicted protein [Naegleria gruberi strain NEG-M]